MDQPIACTLGAAEYKDRTAELAALAERALRSREQTPDGERLVFADRADVERDLRSMIAAESSCCAFLRMDLARRDEGLVLDIAGPQDARPGHRGAVRVSAPEKLLGAGALIMALCCALLPLAGAALGGGLIAGAGTVGIVIGAGRARRRGLCRHASSQGRPRSAEHHALAVVMIARAARSATAPSTRAAPTNAPAQSGSSSTVAPITTPTSGVT